MAEPNALQRRALARAGYAMPNGTFCIRAGVVGASDLQNAVDSVGHGQDGPHNAIRLHIMRRARALGLSGKIPSDWQADGSQKRDLLDQQVDNFLEHFGIDGMRWGHHLPGVEVLGGPGNGGGNRKPSPFIQRGDHSDDKPGDSGPPGKDSTPPAHESLDALQALRDKVSQETEAARAEDEDAEHIPEHPLGSNQEPEPPPSKTTSQAPVSTPSAKSAPAKAKTTSAPAKAKPKSKLKKSQATAVHKAAKKHQASIAQIHNKAKALAAAHKKNQAKLAKHPNKAQAKKAIAAAAKLHASHLAHLKKVAEQAHAAHKANVNKIKQPSHLTAKQKEAQHKAALASAKKRHEAALLRKSGVIAAAAKKTAAAQASRTPAQKAAYDKLALNAQNHVLKLSIDDAADAFLEHHGIKGQKWGVRKSVRSAYGFPTGGPRKPKPVSTNKISAGARKVTRFAKANPAATVAVVYGANRVYANREKIVGTAKIVAHIIKVVNQQRKTPQGQEALALGRSFIQGYVIHSDDSLEHHGIKGQKWGIRRNGGHPGEYAAKVPTDSSADHQQAALIRSKVKYHKGIHALSNEEIKTLTDRLSLEANYHRLNPHTGKLDKGRKFVKTVTGDAKTVLDAVNTGQRVVKTVQDAGFSSPHSAGTRRRGSKNQPYRPQFKLTPAS